METKSNNSIVTGAKAILAIENIFLYATIIVGVLSLGATIWYFSGENQKMIITTNMVGVDQQAHDQLMTEVAKSAGKVDLVELNLEAHVVDTMIDQSHWTVNWLFPNLVEESDMKLNTEIGYLDLGVVVDSISELLIYRDEKGKDTLMLITLNAPYPIPTRSIEMRGTKTNVSTNGLTGGRWTNFTWSEEEKKMLADTMELYTKRAMEDAAYFQMLNRWDLYNEDFTFSLYNRLFAVTLANGCKVVLTMNYGLERNGYKMLDGLTNVQTTVMNSDDYKSLANEHDIQVNEKKIIDRSIKIETDDVHQRVRKSLPKEMLDLMKSE